MTTRVVLALLVVGIIAAAAMLALSGVWGESNEVISNRTGSPRGGYGIGSGGVK